MKRLLLLMLFASPAFAVKNSITTEDAARVCPSMWQVIPKIVAYKRNGTDEETAAKALAADPLTASDDLSASWMDQRAYKSPYYKKALKAAVGNVYHNGYMNTASNKKQAVKDCEAIFFGM